MSPPGMTVFASSLRSIASMKARRTRWSVIALLAERPIASSVTYISTPLCRAVTVILGVVAKLRAISAGTLRMRSTPPVMSWAIWVWRSAMCVTTTCFTWTSKGEFLA